MSDETSNHTVRNVVIAGVIAYVAVKVVQRVAFAKKVAAERKAREEQQQAFSKYLNSQHEKMDTLMGEICGTRHGFSYSLSFLLQRLSHSIGISK